jgi:hypothetical protein
MNGTEIARLTKESSFIFAGTVTAKGSSSVSVLSEQPGLAVVRFDRGFRVNADLGTLKGRPITVRLRQGGVGAGSVRPGERLVFFSTAWVHGKEIAVHEISRVAADENTEQEVANAVAALPEIHLKQRIASATFVVFGKVVEIARAADIPRLASEHDPFWMRASIEVWETLKGGTDQNNGPGLFLFPGSRDRAFLSVPRPTKGQEAVFLLHTGSGTILKDQYVAPDPADIQAAQALDTIRRLLGSS